MNSPAPTTRRKSWVDFGKGVSMFLVGLYRGEAFPTGSLRSPGGYASLDGSAAPHE